MLFCFLPFFQTTRRFARPKQSVHVFSYREPPLWCIYVAIVSFLYSKSYNLNKNAVFSMRFDAYFACFYPNTIL